jgi:predicted nucleic acid-binding protein
MLVRYEITSALAHAMALGQFEANAVKQASAGRVAPARGRPGHRVLARRLERRSAYDAAYLVLAEHVGAELWTVDSALAPMQARAVCR